MRNHLFSWKDAKPAKTAAVIRYGAIGDAIQTSSIFPLLKEQGYSVTLYCQSGPGHEVLKHDPNIDRFIIQGKDQVPPQFLQEFWDATKVKYGRWINLCESVEGTLLAIPGRANHEWPNEVRAKFMDRNYLEWTHDIAQLPHIFNPKFYSTLDEKAWARKTANRSGARNILWSLSGSSGHKTWPHLDAIIARVMLEYDDVHVTLVGDEFCRILESGWEKEPRVHCQSGKWSIRQSMAFTEVANMIIGTETGLLNAAGHMDTPKIITLSHSSEEMLTKHWKNVIALKQKSGCPKFPCRQLHYTWEYCMQDKETGTAVCQSSIDVNMMWDAIVSVLGVKNRIAA
jgi:ADP-heptose:LPS heptosyltransferase